MRKQQNKRGLLTLISSFLIMVLFLVSGELGGIASAAKLTNRSLTIGDTRPGFVTSYRYKWTYPTSATLGSIRLEACTDGYFLDTCTVPDGIDFSAATFTSQTGATGFTVASQTVNEIVLARTPSSSGSITSTYTFDNVTNPTGLPDTFYIRVRTYATNDGTGPETEVNSVVNATATPINITTEVPPVLFFCAAITTSGECTNVTGNFINYGELRDDITRYGTSQFQVATNADGGYVVTVNGNTMGSGNHIIDRLVTPTAVQTGAAQFGMNLRANTSPPAGSDITGVGTGVVGSDYDTPDAFQYNDGDIVASAVTGSNYDTFTVTYIINVPTNQPAGVYNTTITYICTAAF